MNYDITKNTAHMITKFIFAILCGILYVIGLMFGWNYKETSVYICIYLWPMLCMLCALFTTYKAIRKKKTAFIIVNSIISVVYVLVTWSIFAYYSKMSVEAQFNDCMWKIYGLSDHTGLSYEAINLLIYVVLFSAIVVFHLLQVLIIDGKLKKKVSGNGEPSDVDHPETTKRPRRRWKRAFLWVGGAILCCLLVVLFQPIRLKKQADRSDCRITLSRADKAMLDKKTKNMGERAAINYSIRYTAKKFKYTKQNHLSKGEANCVGYAKYCAAVCNYISERNGLSLRAKPVVGHLYWMGININAVVAKELSPASFYKDHDFVEFSTTKGVVYQDPCLYDLIGRRCKTYRTERQQ